MIFRSDDLGKAWNGALNNSGAILPQAVYVWYLRVGSGITADRKELHGHVTLLKKSVSGSPCQGFLN